MAEEQFSPEESLQVIHTMINKTKENISENRFYFLLWGWLTFAAVLTQFFLKVVMHYPYHYLVWLATIPAAIVTIIKAGRSPDRTHAKTYVGESMSNLWMGIGISFFILSVIISMSIGWLKAWPFFILFYGLGTFISGRFIHFRPLIIGGIMCWILAVASVFVTYDYQMLVTAAAILISYIIPGHLITPEKSVYGRQTNI